MLGAMNLLSVSMRRERFSSLIGESAVPFAVDVYPHSCLRIVKLPGLFGYWPDSDAEVWSSSVDYFPQNSES